MATLLMLLVEKRTIIPLSAFPLLPEFARESRNAEKLSLRSHTLARVPVFSFSLGRQPYLFLCFILLPFALARIIPAPGLVILELTFAVVVDALIPRAIRISWRRRLRLRLGLWSELGEQASQVGDLKEPGLAVGGLAWVGRVKRCERALQIIGRGRMLRCLERLSHLHMGNVWLLHVHLGHLLIFHRMLCKNRLQITCCACWTHLLLRRLRIRV